jgi:hypothetical protein
MGMIAVQTFLFQEATRIPTLPQLQILGDQADGHLDWAGIFSLVAAS